MGFVLTCLGGGAFLALFDFLEADEVPPVAPGSFRPVLLLCLLDLALFLMVEVGAMFECGVIVSHENRYCL